MDLWTHIKWINHAYHIVWWYISHYLYQYFLKVFFPPGNHSSFSSLLPWGFFPMFVSLRSCRGFWGLCCLRWVCPWVCISQVPRPWKKHVVFFHKGIHTHTHMKWCCFVGFKETTREVFQVMDIQFESQKRTCSDDNKEIFGIKTADEPDRFRVVCLNIGRSM